MGCKLAMTRREFLLLMLLGVATAAEAQVQPELARRYFEEATKLC
jgi:hypothetical protein